MGHDGGVRGLDGDHYARYRRDLPEAAVHQVVEHVSLDDLSLVVDLGADRDLPLLRDVLGGARVDLVAVANALHFMDAARLFTDVRSLLCPGGGLATVSHGLPLWLADTDWARVVKVFLEDWFQTSTGGTCGLDDRSREERARLLETAGFVDVTELRHEYDAELTADYVVGHLYSALSDGQVPG